MENLLTKDFRTLFTDILNFKNITETDDCLHINKCVIPKKDYVVDNLKLLVQREKENNYSNTVILKSLFVNLFNIYSKIDETALVIIFDNIGTGFYYYSLDLINDFISYKVPSGFDKILLRVSTSMCYVIVTKTITIRTITDKEIEITLHSDSKNLYDKEYVFDNLKIINIVSKDLFSLFKNKNIVYSFMNMLYFSNLMAIDEDFIQRIYDSLVELD